MLDVRTFSLHLVGTLPLGKAGVGPLRWGPVDINPNIIPNVGILHYLCIHIM